MGRLQISEDEGSRTAGRAPVEAGVPQEDDPQVDDEWTCRHFSLSNPVGDGATDLPRLLRRVADHLEGEGIGPMQILDLTVTEDMTETGPWWSVTVYWTSEAAVEEATPDA